MKPLSQRISRREFYVCAAGGLAAIAGRGAATKEAVAGPRTRVEDREGIPTFTVHGESWTTPCFETYAPEEKYFRQFAAAGSRVFMFNTNAAACDYGHSPPVWRDEGTWDYSGFTERAERVLSACPDALFLPRVNLGTPRWWLASHPEALERFDDGSTVPREGGPTLPPDRPFPSLASRQWRSAIGGALERYVRWVQDSKYAPHIFGYFLSGLHTEEFYHWGASTRQLAGYSAATADAFRGWLRHRYGSVESLRRAWRSAEVDFDTASVPSREERLAPGDGTFRDAARQRNVIDFYLFWNELIPETILDFARIARQASGGEKVVGAFYGYLYEFAGDPEFGHNGVARLLESPLLDFMAVTASYTNRAAGTGSDYARSPAASLRVHGKLWYHDNDVVSFRARKIMQRLGFSEKADWTRNLSVQLRSLGYTDTAQKSRWMYRRGVGFALCQGMYASWFDLHGGYFDDAELMDEVKRLNRVASETARSDRRSCAEILVVADEVSCSYAAPRSGLLREAILTSQNQLTRIGAPVDHVLATDLARIDSRSYKLVIFLNCWHMTAAQRALVRERFQRDGKHLVWCYAAGLFDETGKNGSAMEELTGFRPVLGPDTGLVAGVIRLLPTDYGVNREFRRRGWKWLKLDPGAAYRAEDEPRYCWPISVEGAGVVPLGHLESTQGVAFARRAMRDWTSVYVMTARLPASAWREMARETGVHLFNEQDDAFYANRSYLCLHANGAGPRTLALPRRGTIRDAITGEVLVRNATSWSREMADGETALLGWS